MGNSSWVSVDKHRELLYPRFNRVRGGLCCCLFKQFFGIEQLLGASRDITIAPCRMNGFPLFSCSYHTEPTCGCQSFIARGISVAAEIDPSRLFGWVEIKSLICNRFNPSRVDCVLNPLILKLSVLQGQWPPEEWCHVYERDDTPLGYRWRQAKRSPRLIPHPWQSLI